jgi:hypothetical protein
LLDDEAETCASIAIWSILANKRQSSDRVDWHKCLEQVFALFFTARRGKRNQVFYRLKQANPLLVEHFGQVPWQAKNLVF